MMPSTLIFPLPSYAATDTEELDMSDIGELYRKIDDLTGLVKAGFSKYDGQISSLVRDSLRNVEADKRRDSEIDALKRGVASSHDLAATAARESAETRQLMNDTQVAMTQHAATIAKTATGIVDTGNKLVKSNTDQNDELAWQSRSLKQIKWVGMAIATLWMGISAILSARGH